MVRKTRMAKVSYVVCDYCNKEIIANSHISRDDGKEHYHSVYRDDEEGNLIKPCIKLLEEKELKEYIENEKTNY